MAQCRVATDAGVLGAVVHGVVVPVLHGDDREVRAVADHHLDGVGEHGRALERQHDGRLAVRFRDHDQVSGFGAVERGAVDAAR